MDKANPKISVKKPKNILFTPIKADFKKLLTAFIRGIGHTVSGNWPEIPADVVEALCAIGLETNAGELAYLLIKRSIIRAVVDLASDIPEKLNGNYTSNIKKIVKELDTSEEFQKVKVDKKFFDRPGDIPFVHEIERLLKRFLEESGMNEATAKAFTDRFSSYFVYALNVDWKSNSKSYRPIIDEINSPFLRASEREFAWTTYTSLLQRRIQESVFDEPFSLKQIYIPLNAYYSESQKTRFPDTKEVFETNRLVVTSLHDELLRWLKQDKKQDVIRVISGGPGSGKSSFAKIFAAEVSQRGEYKVLFVPLHLIDPTKELADEVGGFVRDEGILISNPLDSDSPEPNLLIIFDGLDELASQGKATTETARAFLREVERTVERRNPQDVNIRILISGRELIVQENESDFRKPRQILTLLPYYVRSDRDVRFHMYADGNKYYDPNKILGRDLRHDWWRNYGALTGRRYSGLPKELDRDDLEEITEQPLLNYLVALSFTRNKIDFTKDVNLNSVYEDLLSAVYERGYEKRRTYDAIRHMSVDDFTRILEEIGLAAWHGDGRTTTISEIQKHCEGSGLDSLLESFKEGAKVGVTRLLAAFFFRQYGKRSSGDPTFVFTHKSFGEYLTARRVIRAVARIIKELKKRSEDPDEGWDCRDALKHWLSICGSTAVSQYLHSFLLNEIKLISLKILKSWQEQLTKLFSYMLKNGMPLELMPHISPFREAMFHARNAEEALLVILNACARQTQRISEIIHPSTTSFGVWFKRIQGQRVGPESVLAANCLSYLYLSSAVFDMIDFYNADLSHSDLSHIMANFTCFGKANLKNATMKGSICTRANFEFSNISGVDFTRSRLDRANLCRCIAVETNFKNCKLDKCIIDRETLCSYPFENVKINTLIVCDDIYDENTSPKVKSLDKDIKS